ncbi:hypothetical protein KTC96_23825 (plasmid) [Clostridium estertheticum]|uniref:hypothetical protein n=1 Tax=Clostridium estertheticum TaxID=238834 RepID=UPI001C7CCBDA|nr:hypothetical protein [Clostridium estertheticum]MBX4262197.1 hypothetical protein [Clostridium estertheticum]WLC73241.1 hypothetical protein KTC96_23825 [Clostridium estertheticum]
MEQIIINEEKLENRILEEGGGTLDVNCVIRKCLEIDANLKPILNEWVETGTIKDTWVKNGKVEEITVEGFTIKRLMKMYDRFSSAIIRMNLLIKHPEKIKHMLEILEKDEKIIM